MKYKITYIQRSYLYTEKPGSQFPPTKCEKKTSPKEQHSRQGYKSMSWNGLKCVNITYTGNII